MTPKAMAALPVAGAWCTMRWRRVGRNASRETGARAREKKMPRPTRSSSSNVAPGTGAGSKARGHEPPGPPDAAWPGGDVLLGDTDWFSGELDGLTPEHIDKRRVVVLRAAAAPEIKAAAIRWLAQDARGRFGEPPLPGDGFEERLLADGIFFVRFTRWPRSG